MTHRSRVYQLIEDRLEEPLDEYVFAARDAGKSWTTISFDLRDRTQVGVISETLRTWFVAEIRERERAKSAAS